MDRVLKNIIEQIEKAQTQNSHLLLVIDGKCGSGKTTLSKWLGGQYDCNVFHMDDFYLPLVQQTETVMRKPGGNINYERFIDEVMMPLCDDRPVMYRPFLCIGQSYASGTVLKKTGVNIIEGTYSCHPKLREIYERMKRDKWKVITLFMDIDDDNQIERVRKRVGEQRFKLFEAKWIPRERDYFEKCLTQSYCEYSIFGTDEINIKL